MSRSQFQSKRFILRHAWLNLWDERMTTGRINQVAILAFLCLVPQEYLSRATMLHSKHYISNKACQATLSSHSHFTLTQNASDLPHDAREQTHTNTTQHTTKCIQSPIQSISGSASTQPSKATSTPSATTPSTTAYLYSPVQTHAHTEQSQAIMSYQHHSARVTWEAVAETKTALHTCSICWGVLLHTVNQYINTPIMLVWQKPLPTPWVSICLVPKQTSWNNHISDNRRYPLNDLALPTGNALSFMAKRTTLQYMTIHTADLRPLCFNH